MISAHCWNVLNFWTFWLCNIFASCKLIDCLKYLTWSYLTNQQQDGNLSLLNFLLSYKLSSWRTNRIKTEELHPISYNCFSHRHMARNLRGSACQLYWALYLTDTFYVDPLRDEKWSWPQWDLNLEYKKLQQILQGSFFHCCNNSTCLLSWFILLLIFYVL